MANVLFESVSTNTISVGQILVSTVYARTVSTQRVFADTLQGDGSALTNLDWLSLNGTIPQGKYQAYSIPWMAMEDIGSINLRQGTWLHGGLISPASLSVITSVETSTLFGNYGMIRQFETSSLRASVVSSIAISTNTLDVGTNFFRTQIGDIQYVASSFVKYLCTVKFEANDLEVQSFSALDAAFSTLSVGTWTVDVLQTNRLSFLDYATNLYSYFTLSNSTFYIDSKWLMDGVVYTSSLTSTTSNVLFRLDVLSNFLNPHPALSAMSTVVGSSFQTLQTTASTLSTAVGQGCNFNLAFTSNTSTGIQSNFVSLCNWTNLSISNVSTTITNRLSNDEVATDVRFTTTSNYFANAIGILSTGISTSISNVSVSILTLSTQTANNASNFSVITNSNFTNLYAGVSSVGQLMATGISTTWSNTSTVSGSNQSAMLIYLSQSSSNLSTTSFSNLSILQLGLSTTASNLSVLTYASLSSLGTAISTLSTSVGQDTSTLRIGLSTVAANLSTTAGSNFSVLQLGLSSYSTVIGSNISDLRLSVSTTGSTFSTLISFNMSTLQLALSTYSTIAGSNFSSLYIANSTLAAIVSSGFSTLSSQIQSTQNLVRSTITSTVAGLGTAGYVSTLSLLSTVAGLGTASYISSLSLQSTVAGLGTASYVSSLSLQSTVAGLGSASYISSPSLQSTVAGLGTASYISSLTLLSTIAGLGTAGYISSPSLLSSLTSTVAGLGTASYISSLSLRSTVAGLGTASYISSLSLQSTVAGLGTASYISSLSLQSSLQSTVAGLGTSQYLSTASLLSTLDNLGGLGYISSLQLISTSSSLTNSISNLSIFTQTLKYNYVGTLFYFNQNQSVNQPYPLQTTSVSTFTHSTITSFPPSSSFPIVSFITDASLGDVIPAGTWRASISCRTDDTAEQSYIWMDAYTSNVSGSNLLYSLQSSPKKISYTTSFVNLDYELPTTTLNTGDTLFLLFYGSNADSVNSYNVSLYTQGLNYSYLITTLGDIFPNPWFRSTVSGITTYVSSFMSTAIGQIPYQYTGTTLYLNPSTRVSTSGALETFQTRGPTQTSTISVPGSTSNVSLVSFLSDFEVPNYIPEGIWDITLFANTTATNSNMRYYVNIFSSNSGVSTLLATSCNVPSLIQGTTSMSFATAKFFYTDLNPGDSILIQFLANNSGATSANVNLFFENDNYSYVYTTFGSIFPGFQVQSTVAGLAQVGYISSLSLQSTIAGLGTIGYVSSTQLISTTSSILYYVSTFTSAAIANIPYQYAGATLYLNYTVPQGQFGSLENFTTSVAQQTSTFTLTGNTSNQYLMAFKSDFGVPSFIPTGIWDLNLFNQTSDTNTNVRIWVNLVASNGTGSNIVATTSTNVWYSSNILGQAKISFEVPFTSLASGTSIYLYLYGNNAGAPSKTLTLYFEDGDYSHLHTTFGTLIPENVITSTVTGLGTLGYISSLSLRSTVQGLGSAGYVSTFSLMSTVQGLGQFYLSTPPLIFSTVSTIVSTGIFQTLSTQAFFYSSVNGIAFGARIAQYQTFTF